MGIHTGTNRNVAQAFGVGGTEFQVAVLVDTRNHASLVMLCVDACDQFFERLDSRLSGDFSATGSDHKRVFQIRFGNVAVDRRDHHTAIFGDSAIRSFKFLIDRACVCGNFWT